MADGWSAQIDAYCERAGSGFWAEPVNAVTNAAFLIAAALVGLALARRGRIEAGTGTLLGLMAVIGVGSFLFHTVATRWAALADTLPIGGFIVVYLVLTLRRGFHLGWSAAWILGLAFVPAAGALGAGLQELTGGALGASIGYLPPLLALLVCAGLLMWRDADVGRRLLLSAAIFAVSLGFRTLDGPLCPLVPLGTHFLWHGLNGILLGQLVWTLGVMTAHAPETPTRRDRSR